MSRRGPEGPNLAKFETHSRRRKLRRNARAADAAITALTYLQPQPQVITVVTKAQLLRALSEERSCLA